MNWTSRDQLRSTVQSLASQGYNVAQIMRKLSLQRDEVTELMRDEPRIHDAPTGHPRGSDERILVYQSRVERGLRIFTPGDSESRVPAGYISKLGKFKDGKKGSNKNR